IIQIFAIIALTGILSFFALAGYLAFPHSATVLRRNYWKLAASAYGGLMGFMLAGASFGEAHTFWWSSIRPWLKREKLDGLVDLVRDYCFVLWATHGIALGLLIGWWAANFFVIR